MNNHQELSYELYVFKVLTVFREPLFRKIIGKIAIPPGSKGLDAGCGPGFITRILAEQTGKEGHVTGLDISRDFLDYANKMHKQENLDFVYGDVNNLPFDDGVFDWVWSVDTVWPGPKEMGCPAENPSGIIHEYHRVLKPGGKIFILYWTSQKLLPGYPILEARLNTTSSATAPFAEHLAPENHVMNARKWLQDAGFKDTCSRTFLHDINAPLSENDRESLFILFDMLWSSAEKELDIKDYQKYKSLCDPLSPDNVLNNTEYSGFYTYTMFKGLNR
ncbi:MAG: methyltransferase domain-containing protein [Bacteroidetes bacterium]|nr:methyltransferase domain-containing protein [Bacteroidota bacterium]